FWINKLEAGHLKFDREYIDKATLILGSLLFDKYQKIDKSGQKVAAAEGFVSLYNTAQYPRKIKAESAFNASVLFLELGNVDESVSWIHKSFELFQSTEISILLPKIFSISEQYYLLQSFRASADLSSEMFDKYCTQKYEQKDSFFRQAAQFYLIEDKTSKALKIFNNAAKCGVTNAVYFKTGEMFIAHFYKNNQYADFISFFQDYNQVVEWQKKFGGLLTDLYWVARQDPSTSWASRLKKVYTKIADNRYQADKDLITFVSDLKEFENYVERTQEFGKLTFKEQEVFNPDVFNQELEKHLTDLKELTEKGVKLIKKGHPQIALGTYYNLGQCYWALVQALSSIKPQGVPADFIKGFKVKMAQVTNEISKQAQDYYSQGRKLMISHDIFGAFNQSIAEGISPVAVRNSNYPAAYYLTPMDRNSRSKHD
ncbi:MAG: hypothetical protein WCG27_06620, partial [Pseudomonadota bacterium]